MTIYIQKKQILFNNKIKYYPQAFSKEYLSEYTKCFETIIMIVTSKNKSSKNGKKKEKYIVKKKEKEIIRDYGLNHYRNLSEKKRKKESMEEMVIKFSSIDAKRKTQRICIKITVNN